MNNLVLRMVHGHFITLTSIYGTIAKRSQRTVIAHSHSTNPQGNAMQQMVKKLYVAGTKKSADYGIACSEQAGKWVFGSKSYFVLNNAIETKKFRYNAETREEMRIKMGLQDLFVIGIVGSLSPVKNPMGTIAIFKAIHKKNPNTKLLWVGDGPLRQEIEQKLEEEKLTNAIIMTGVRSDVHRLTQAMDVFILPSLWEGLGMVLIEAQASGLHCFISDAVPEEVAITNLCRFLPSDQPERWVEAILLENRPVRRDTSEEIKKAGYDIETTAKWLGKFYQRVVED